MFCACVQHWPLPQQTGLIQHFSLTLCLFLFPTPCLHPVPYMNTQNINQRHTTLLQKSPALTYVKLLLGEYLLSFSDGQHCGCTYLAVLLTSDLSIFTATRTGWWVNSVDETPRNSSRPLASQRCTCGAEGRGNYESMHRQKTRGKNHHIEVTVLVTAGRMTKRLI